MTHTTSGTVETRATTLRAMRIGAPNGTLAMHTLPIRPLLEQEVLLKVSACGVCRTDLHLLAGELTDARYPVTPGHEVVGRVVGRGAAVPESSLGQRVGVPWLASTCGVCEYCRSDRENLCAVAQFTGCTVDGGYADFAIADWRYCLSIPESYSDAAAAPLLCAGLIGYRAYRLAGECATLGLYGFGAAAHLLCQIAVAQGKQVFAFTRPGDVRAQRLAAGLGAVWTGSSEALPPQVLDAALIFAPAGELIPSALRAVRKGGTVVCAGIHMSDIPQFPYSLLWGERTVRSVANLTRVDGRQFMQLAGQLQLRPEIETFALQDAPAALAKLVAGDVSGAAVLIPP